MNIEAVINENNLNFDRYLGTTLKLPYPSFESIRIQPNDTALRSVINLSLNKLYDNFLYLYRMSRIASNVIPVGQVAIAGVSAGDTNFRWYTYAQKLSTSEFTSLTSLGFNYDKADTMLVIENEITDNIGLFISSGHDLSILNFTKKLFSQTIDQTSTISLLLSSQEIYPESNVYWKKIVEFVPDPETYSLFVLDMSGNRIVKYDSEGFYNDNNILEQKIIFLDTIGGFGGHDANNLFNSPRSIDICDSFLYVLDSGNSCVKKFDKDFNWITTYRLMRDFLSAYPMHLSHDSNGNMYVLTDKNVIYKYDNSFQNRFDIALDSLSANEETYIKLIFSPTDDSIFYVLSDKNIYKKLVTQPDEDIGRYLTYIYRVNTDERYLTMTSLPLDGNDCNFVLSQGLNGIGKIILWKDNANLFDILSVKDFDIYTIDTININHFEYLQNWVFNKAIAKLLLNHMRLRDQITGKFIAERDSKNNITFRGTRYFLPKELDTLKFGQDVTNYIGMNEIFQNNIVNRCLKKIFDIQLALLDALQADILKGFDEFQTVYID